MPTPDARPVGETAEPIRPVAVMRSVVGDAFDRMVSTVIEEQHGEHHEFNSVDCIHAFYDVMEEFEAAVRAEARAALLRDAPVVWIGRDGEGAVVALDLASGAYETLPEPFDSISLSDLPPGTVRRYALVPIEEEGT